jgi:hypothetical protein
MRKIISTVDSPRCIGFAVRVRKLVPDAHGKQIEGHKLKMRWAYKTASRVYSSRSAAEDFLEVLLRQTKMQPGDAWVTPIERTDLSSAGIEPV